MQWAAPWQPIKAPAEADALLAELRRELPPSHLLAGLPLRAIGRRCDCDEVLFAVEDGSGRVASVHITWRSAREVLPWPVSSLYDDPAAWAVSPSSGQTPNLALQRTRPAAAPAGTMGLALGGPGR